MAFNVRQIMSRSVISVGPETTLVAAAQLIREHHFRHLPVVDRAHHVIGMVSQRDLVAAGILGARSELVAPDDKRTVEAIMKRILHVVRPEDPVAKAGAMMLNNSYDSLPVVHAQRLVGIVTSSDFIRLVVENADRFGAEVPLRWRD